MPSFQELITDLISLDTLYSAIKILLSVILAGFIGLEREFHGRPAGLRTHILVSVGACLVMIISLKFSMPPYDTSRADPTRIASNIVTGVGFLGAGCILHAHGDIKGITTAATLWVSAMIGMGCGIGYWGPTIITTVFVMITLTFLRVIEVKINKKAAVITLILEADKPALKNILNVCMEQNAKIKKIDTALIIYNQKECLRVKLEFEKAITKRDLENVVIALKSEVQPINLSLRNDLSAGV
ncbi:MAG: MgtC/SapB family protein [Bacillales bacterium]|jgi:putative Mg2+ transporter-C (MgtC) family protein|nr:MgtC/SapB family protein [Bacillales bacterium]